MKILMNFGDYNHTEDRKKLNTYGGVGYYRIINPAKQIKDHEVKVIGKEILDFGDSLEEQWSNVFKQHDVFWTSYFSDDKAGAAIIYHAQQAGKKFIVDVDDNYLDVPESNLLYDKFKPGKRDRAMLNTILSFADAITVSTEPLKERLYEYFEEVHGIKKKIFVIPNLNQIEDWDFKPVDKYGDRIVIGYSGSNSHQDDLKMVMPAIKHVMEKYPNVWFETIGVVEKGLIKEYFAGMNDDCLQRCAMLPATSTFKDYPYWLANQKWDIGIAPLVDTPFTRSKSSIKWLEYSMYKIPTIASRVYPYYIDVQGRKTIEDKKTGLLVRNHEWKQGLEKLIEDKVLRETLGQNAYDHVKDKWQYKNSRINETVNEMLSVV